jgi:hypothetical protein
MDNSSWVKLTALGVLVIAAIQLHNAMTLSKILNPPKQ